PRWFWPLFAVPGIAWLAVLFVVPFYVVLSVAFGTVDPIFRNPVPIWNPAQWYTGTFGQVIDRIFGRGAFLGPPFVRTFGYVAAASALCILISYPVAYYVAKYAGRRKGLLLVLLIAPFWISYIMSMQAILAGMVIVSLPMFGDYFTNNLLSGAPRTSMIGNLIDDSVGTPGQGTNAAVLVLILMIILIVPMLYYVYSTSRATKERA